MPQIHLITVPQETLDAAGARAVVIDVLRASTTVVTALQNGCRSIIPVTTLSEALKTATCYPGALLAGERKTLKPPHFDLGNSPLEYYPQRVLDKEIILTTTNGTRALRTIENAESVVVAALVNLQAVAGFLLKSKKDVLICCAGTEGAFSLEDTLCATLLIRELVEKNPDFTLTESAYWHVNALQFLIEKKDAQTDFVNRLIERSEHARRLIKLGFAEDVAFCARLNVMEVVPRFIDGKLIK